MSSTLDAPVTGFVSIGAWIVTSGTKSLASSCRLAPDSMARRKGCRDMACFPSSGVSWSGLVVPHFGRQLPGVQRDQPIPEDLERREGAIGDGAFDEQPVLVVGEQFQAFDLVPFDSALPTKQSPAVVDLGLEEVPAWIVAAMGRVRNGD